MKPLHYSIDDAQGTTLAADIQGDVPARRAADALANKLGKPVYLYEVGSSEEPEEFAPGVAATIHERGNGCLP